MSHSSFQTCQGTCSYWELCNYTQVMEGSHVDNGGPRHTRPVCLLEHLHLIHCDLRQPIRNPCDSLYFIMKTSVMNHGVCANKELKKMSAHCWLCNWKCNGNTSRDYLLYTAKSQTDLRASFDQVDSPVYVTPPKISAYISWVHGTIFGSNQGSEVIVEAWQLKGGVGWRSVGLFFGLSTQVTISWGPYAPPSEHEDNVVPTRYCLCFTTR